MCSPLLTITRIHRSSQLSMPREKKNQNQDSPNSNSQLLSLCHEANSSHLTIDDNLWMQDLKNMQDDSFW